MRAIDVRHLGRERVICVYEIDGVIVDPGPQSGEATLLEALGERFEPRAILLTHIHLDHAGATGSLVRRWPDVPVYVHENGAPHLIDPSKLLASASRLYPDLEERWGEVVPVPEANVHVVGDAVLDEYRVAYTPGHAWHHVSYLHEASGVAFTGDTMGVRIAPAPFTVMPTPPPDIDPEAWRKSIATIVAWRPETCAVTHFGTFDDVDALAADALEELEACVEAARDRDRDAYLDWYAGHLESRVPDAENRETLMQASPPALEYLGLERYWRKRRSA